MVVIIHPDAQARVALSQMLRRFDDRLAHEELSHCDEAWLVTKACRPWLVLCDSAAEAAFDYFVRVREELPECYFIFTGHTGDAEVLANAGGVVANISFEKLLPHFRAARGRQRRKAEPGKGSGRSEKAEQSGAARVIQVTVETGEMKFSMPAQQGNSLKSFLETLGKVHVPQARLFRGGELLGNDLDTALEAGDRVEVLHAEDAR